MPADSDAPDRRQPRKAIPDNVVAASRAKFLHFGVSRTTMADISRDVGMPRQTMYEFVSSRDELVEAVLIQRIREIAEEVKPRSSPTSFGAALVGTAVAAIRFARSDRELMNIWTTGPKEIVQKVVVGRCQEIHDIVGRLFDPILQKGLQSKLLRLDKTRDEIVDWFRIVFLALITQVDISPEVEETFIGDFLLASVLTNPKSTADLRGARPASHKKR
jgi:AcrR family transcriptional regulator